LPWDYNDSEIEVALTGKAFNHILINKDVDPFTYRSVCAKAQVFARMSPEDKEALINSLQEVLNE
jgi:magnesium-transporting ATPase (P-type)